MATRGLYGLRKNGIDKTSYNHFDSYPDELGRNILSFIKGHSVEEMNAFYNRIIMVSEQAIPTTQEIENCIINQSIDLNVSTRSYNDWYCLLRYLQGELGALYECKISYMIDEHEFIKDSLFCKYAYIINLDTNKLEFYKGFQTKPQKGNRYGETSLGQFYPCALIAEIPFTLIHHTDIDKIINQFMKED